MTYKDQFVAEIKVNNKILRIKDDAVYLPFGSEYSIFLKNLNSRRAAVNISIDGEDVLDGSSLILDANSSTNIEGYLRGNVARNAFKFIQKTKNIQDHRGDKIDDGMVRIEFAFEKPQPEPPIKKVIEEVHNHYHYSSYLPRFDYYGSNSDWTFKDFTMSNGGDDVVRSMSFCSSKGPICGSTVEKLGVKGEVVADELGAPLVDEGITVKGSEINQSFCYSSIGELEQSQVIILRLKGMTETNAQISKPVTVKTKLICSTCGTKSSSSCKFCPECGTFLE